MRLLEVTKLGNARLQNRMAMAPMTRSRADMHGVVGDLTVLYYAQRAPAGLLITEAIRQSFYTGHLYTKSNSFLEKSNKNYS
jgi:N-ethylmaleimide reductase